MEYRVGLTEWLIARCQYVRTQFRPACIPTPLCLRVELDPSDRPRAGQRIGERFGLAQRPAMGIMRFWL